MKGMDMETIFIKIDERDGDDFACFNDGFGKDFSLNEESLKIRIWNLKKLNLSQRPEKHALKALKALKAARECNIK